jgi:hypothetical protein
MAKVTITGGTILKPILAPRKPLVIITYKYMTKNRLEGKKTWVNNIKDPDGRIEAKVTYTSKWSFLKQ